MDEAPALPSHLPEAPAPVEERLRSRFVLIRSVWFPTQRELRAWDASGSLLYVRPLGPGAVEIGPRLASLWAACFAPVDELRLAADAGGTTLVAHRRLPRFTTGLLAVWWVLTVLWGVERIPAVLAGESPAWLLFWTILAVSATTGPAMGWVFGGQALDAARPQLLEALATPDLGEDW